MGSEREKDTEEDLRTMLDIITEGPLLQGRPSYSPFNSTAQPCIFIFKSFLSGGYV